MITFQDFETANNREDFIIQIITEFKGSNFYNRALESRQYFKGENSNILARKMQFLGQGNILKEDITKANNQIPNSFYAKIIKQANNYLLGAGVKLDDTIKKNLGKRFDIKVNRAGLKSHIDGVSWGYCFLGSQGFNIDIWDGIEFIPIYDERTGLLRAGIRYWQVDLNKPTYIELYEEDGITEYVLKDSKLETTKAKTGYIITRAKDQLEETIIGEDNWSVLPIVPLYSNVNRVSSLTTSLKNKIDLYDIIISDFGNNLEDSQDVYWVIKNYMGQDLGTFIEDYKYYKSIKVAGDGDATAHTIEVPWQAREKALEILKKNIYDEAMAVDIATSRNGSNETTVAIDALFYDLDMKTNEFEQCVIDFIEGVIELWQEYSNNNKDYTISFTRNKLKNRTEYVDMIYSAREDLSRKKTLQLIADIIGLDVNEIDSVLDEIDSEGMNSIDRGNNIQEEV